ncbi:MAG: hypothetical protein VW238_02005 [Nitrosomonadales bacterium]|jgi:hypothetical protein
MKRKIILIFTFITLIFIQLQAIGHDYNHFSTHIQQSQSNNNDLNKGCEDCVKFKHLNQFTLCDIQTNQLPDAQNNIIQLGKSFDYTKTLNLLSARGPPQFS